MRDFGRPPYRYPGAEDPPDPTQPSGLPGDGPIESQRALWLYIFKGLGLMLLAGFVLTNLMYGFWELLALLGD